MKILPEFKELIPPLGDDEYKKLEESCIKEGIRDKILLWNEYIIDGHHRYKISKEHNLEFKTLNKSFDNKNDVKIWMILNQLSRRNISDFVKGELMQIIEKLLREKGEQNLKTNIGNNQRLSIVDKGKDHNTQKIIADKLGWSTGKKAMFDVVRKKAPEETKEKLRTGEVSINAAYNEIKKEEKKESIKEQRRLLAEEGSKKEINIDFRLGDFEEVFADLKDGSIDCIITDPPYPYEFIEVWTKLSRFAKRVLKPNGFCIAYSGQMHLPEVMKRMSEHLDYYWTFAMYHEGQTQIVNGVNLICRWKPVLIFQKNKKKINNTIQDYFISEQREKQAHNWQQSVSGVSYLIEMFTKPNDLILEPFAGGGTTIIAAKEKHRNIIAAEIDNNTYNIAKEVIWQQEKNLLV